MKTQVTGRIQKSPDEAYIENVLFPQFEFELENYLHHYLNIEKVFLKAYKKMGILTEEEVYEIWESINQIDMESILNISRDNMTDIAFSIERVIEHNLSKPIAKWHIDRSRNDFQACAQLMYARDKWIQLTKKMNSFAQLVMKKAEKYTHTVMPGYTHYQSAQIISVGFYLTAISRHLLKTINKMSNVLDAMNNQCPLGSGAMSGQEYEWDCSQMANDLGFQSYIGHALSGVASREWVLEIAGCISFFSNNMSRFLTDIMHWGSSEYQFIDLPDELTGISSSMPQKRNFPIVERLRGKTSHLLSYHIDFLIGQRNTPYSNLVEVSKEASRNLSTLFNETDSLLDLLILVFENISFKEENMKQRCALEYYGGFTLANILTEKSNIPYRKAQVIAGRFVTKSLESNIVPAEASIQLLNKICTEYGYSNKVLVGELRNVFNVEKALFFKTTQGSTNPKAVEEILKSQQLEREELCREFYTIMNKIGNRIDMLKDWRTIREEII
ncbi:lyase family protein [Bacillus paranthracis]|uniref:argininosuccinate lyase n=1 Tax=Bacillus TaxID=1386 RepID=UPI000200F367|nr:MULTISPECIES: lyase family protein [Bacillus]ADY24344.1 putative argininosuccinate lyase [Bacillus thuringiensis serovar finitimus YBT-020]MCW4575057.1 lyase family protein [Bacillus pacificus]MDA1585504.1 lyase family protein [Bacillus cereus group sp. TH230-1LC]MRC72448.1 argininosuccinate lyase [Bacillus thuringiensis]OTX73120.1 argininosuccinate lyase [Bacillus thuringiensis serovar finitimus]